MSSGLFGIKHSNRSEDDHWGKNCFNSSFPAATANYMMAKDIPAIYIHLDIVNGKPKVVASEIPVRWLLVIRQTRSSLFLEINGEHM